MALAPSISTASRNAAADAVVDRLDLGSSPPELRIYSGTKPADVNAALSGNTLLAALLMDASAAFGAASSGVATAAAITSDTSADATGTATFFRMGQVTTGTFTPEIQGEVGTSGSDLNLSSTSITAGGTVSVSSFTYTQQGS
jgi:hypothetical protein